MRYLIAESQEFEISARCEYLYDVFQLYFFPHNKIGGFIPLVPVGTAEPSILFIVGHQDQVDTFLKDNIEDITERTIVIVSCFGQSFNGYKKSKKTIYTSIANKEGYSWIYRGQDYGFKFDITRSELDFYNSSEKNILQRIKNSFYKI